MEQSVHKNTRAKVIATVVTYGFDELEFFSLFAGLLAISKTIYDIVIQDYSEYWYFSFVVGVLSIGYSVFNVIRKISKFNRDLSLYYEKEEEDYEVSISERIKLPKNYDDYIKELYINKSYKEYYLYSPKVNQMIFELPGIKYTKSKFCYQIPKDMRKYVPFALKKRLQSNRQLFNGKSWGLATDLSIQTKEVEIKKTKYFDMLATNHLVFKKIRSKYNISELFDGTKLIYGDDNQIIRLSESAMSDIIGVNTLAITKDGYLIISRQGVSSEVSPADYVPSGSGSLKRSDVRKNKSSNFLELVAFGATRELIEECNLPQKTVIYTKTIGYVRLLKRGGKPDFFGISVIELDMETIKGYLKTSSEIKKKLMMEPTFVKIDVNNIEKSIVDTIANLEMDNKIYDKTNESSKVSLQLHVTGKFIKDLIVQNCELYNQLFNKFDYKN